MENRISGKRLASSLTSAERFRLISWLKNFRLEVTDYRPIREAIVTAGGIATDEIDPETMESYRIKGLYVAGETLDINGTTGGYNLQAAFSTGWLAGRSAASALLKS
jgi:predicted flavoprotein YhiN